MKKIVSLVTVALFAMTFAAGCGKPTKCTEAKKEADCKADFFDKEKDDKGNCEWIKNPSDATKGDCKVKVDHDATGKAACTAAKKDQSTCETASKALSNAASHECKWTAATAAGNDQKCEYQAKP